eukprot:GILK01007724.1.p1 GENE.GILK01007724.1~~GILK01007724.1.p1  ORF type:complete len:266 (+),score=34.76 GILK01007724.1:73-870(+)
MAEELWQKICSLNKLAEESDQLLKKINRFHQMFQEQDLTKSIKARRKVVSELKPAYVEALTTWRSLERDCETTSKRLSAHKRSGGTSETPHSKKAKTDVSTVHEPDQVEWDGKGPLPTGFKVAACVGRSHDPPLWILATIGRYMANHKRYEVFDADPQPASDDEGGGTKPPTRHVVPSNLVLPLPREGYPEYMAEFPKNSVVFAMFPNTTTFYPATVVTAPKKNQKKNREYRLQFEDDHEFGVDTKRMVPATHVVQYRDANSKKS